MTGDSVSRDDKREDSKQFINYGFIFDDRESELRSHIDVVLSVAKPDEIWIVGIELGNMKPLLNLARIKEPIALFHSYC